MSKIITHQYFNRFSWKAYHLGDGSHCGYGLTEALALADLALMDEERAEAFMHIALRDEADLLAESGQ